MQSLLKHSHRKVNVGLRGDDICATSCAFTVCQSHTGIANLLMTLFAGASAYPIRGMDVE
jgi:hypothetical protein